MKRHHETAWFPLCCVLHKCKHLKHVSQLGGNSILAASFFFFWMLRIFLWRVLAHLSCLNIKDRSAAFPLATSAVAFQIRRLDSTCVFWCFSAPLMWFQTDDWVVLKSPTPTHKTACQFLHRCLYISTAAAAWMLSLALLVMLCEATKAMCSIISRGTPRPNHTVFGPAASATTRGEGRPLSSALHTHWSNFTGVCEHT